MSPHEEFLELCAASTAGELIEEERRKLDEHLQGCAACCEARKQFQKTVTRAVPAIAAGLPQDDPQPDTSWSEDKAEAKLFERLAKEDSRAGSRRLPKDIIGGAKPSHHRAYFPSRFDWGQMWMSYAAAVLLFLALAISAYRVGIRRGVEVATNAPARQGKGSNFLEEQLSDISRDRETLRTQLAERDKAIAELKRQIAHLGAKENDRPGSSAPAESHQKDRSAEEAAGTTLAWRTYKGSSMPRRRCVLRNHRMQQRSKRSLES